jgi:hypothetical protein
VADLELHPELERFERLLTNSRRPKPPDALRQRVLGDVRTQLRRQRVVRRWQLVAAFAATFLIGTGFSLAVARTTSYAMQRQNARPSVYALAEEIQKHSPELSPEEAVRRAMLVQIAAQSGHETVQGSMFPFPSAGSVKTEAKQ